MKSNSLTVTPSRNREHVTTVSNPFTWEKTAAFYRRALPLSFLELSCASGRDAKFITGILLIGPGVAFLPILIPAMLILVSALMEKKGGEA